MKLLAISDLHVANPANMAALQALEPAPDDWLILAGDIAERLEHLRDVFAVATARFARVIWVPGNHELWTVTEGARTGGQAKYEAVVDLARSFDVITPEDEFPLWTGTGGPCLIVPLFLHYDYSFRPAAVARADVVAWAKETGMSCADELLLDTSPYADADTWCAARCAAAERRLEAERGGLPTVLVNHYPLRHDLVWLPRIPRFAPWCGTTRTEDWHRRFDARAVVSGHLHVRRTDWRDGVRFEEVSLGYPRQWDQARGLAPYLREILPGPERY